VLLCADQDVGGGEVVTQKRWFSKSDMGVSDKVQARKRPQTRKPLETQGLFVAPATLEELCSLTM